jgi:hypothetical protein
METVRFAKSARSGETRGTSDGLLRGVYTMGFLCNPVSRLALSSAGSVAVSAAALGLIQRLVGSFDKFQVPLCGRWLKISISVHRRS